jgi:hypothetical protein
MRDMDILPIDVLAKASVRFLCPPCFASQTSFWCGFKHQGNHDQRRGLAHQRHHRTGLPRFACANEMLAGFSEEWRDRPSPPMTKSV